MWFLSNKYINKIVWLFSPVKSITLCPKLLLSGWLWIYSDSIYNKTSFLLMLQVCEILEDNALTSKSVNGECEPWVVASRLRDHLLLPRERRDSLLWKKVVLKLFWNYSSWLCCIIIIITNQSAKQNKLIHFIWQ